MTEAFEPRVEEVRLDDDQSEPRIRWGDGYSVIALGDRGRPYDLPGRPCILGPEETLRQRDVLLFGERSGGVRDLLDWWRGLLDKENRPWIVVHGAQWSRHLLTVSKKARAQQQKAEASGGWGPLDAVEALGAAESDNEKAEQLIRWARDLKSPFHLVIREFSEMPNAQAEAFARAFRIVRDQQACPNLHLLIGSVSDTVFKDSALWSGYLAMSHCYRLPSFGALEIRALLRWYEERRQGGLTMSDDAVNELLDATGGQPLLVQELLKGVVEKTPSGEALRIEKKEVKEAFLRMKRSPPDITSSWQDDLRRVLEAERDLIPSMISYLSGRTLSPLQLPPPSSERPLMVSGWVKMNRFGRWGISSLLHSVVGRPVLDEISRDHR